MPIRDQINSVNCALEACDRFMGLSLIVNCLVLKDPMLKMCKVITKVEYESVDSKNNKNTYLLFLKNQFRQNRCMPSMLQNIIPITRIEISFRVRTPFSYLCKNKSDSFLFRKKFSVQLSSHVRLMYMAVESSCLQDNCLNFLRLLGWVESSPCG